MLGVGLVWTVLIRVPFVLNARDHLDSDLAVDGLTLLDAVTGRWRWHYPGTPYIGIPPVLFSYAQALLWGANPITLVSGGTVIWLLVVASTFWLAKTVYGLEVAGWAIVPLVFSSIGAIWLSGRVTGGHLLALVWHTVAWAGLHACLSRGGTLRAAALGLWCGLGLYVDAMFLFTLAALVPTACVFWLKTGRSKDAIKTAIAFSVALAVGLLPREVGRNIDPYDAYPSQFKATLEWNAILEHGRLLGLHCLPRLIAGTELPELERAGASIHTLGLGLVTQSAAQLRLALPGRNEWQVVLFLCGFVFAFFWLMRDRGSAADPVRRAVSRGTVGSAILIVLAFMINRNVYNSDNYRYLVFLLTPWALGFGLVMSDFAQRGWAGRLTSWTVAGILVVTMTSATFFWYRDERLYVNQRGIPVSLSHLDWSELTLVPDVPRGSPGDLLEFVVPADVTHVFGGYWDVYKMAFLSSGRVVGIPFPMYPNRFRGWSRGLGPGQGKLLVLLPELAVRRSRSNASVNRGTGLVGSAQGTQWSPALKTAWAQDGRDPAELSRLRIVVP
jgi:hypothetical protein